MKSRICTAAFTLLLAFTISSLARCAVIQVSSSGSDSCGGSSCTLAKQTIVGALASASSGDEVWVAADNQGGSGLYQVELWSRKDSGEWAYTGQSATTGSGSFSFVPSGSGTYYFDLVAQDIAGTGRRPHRGTGTAARPTDWSMRAHS